MKDFTVQGSIALREAFLKESGIEAYNEKTLSDYHYLIPASIIKIGTFSGANKERDVHFKLPRDWDEALEYTKKYFKKEEEFKVGDWVITNGYSDDYDGLALKITKIDDEFAYFYSSSRKWLSSHNFGLYHIERRATQREIDEAQNIKMPFGNIEFTLKPDGYAYHTEGNVHINDIKEVLVAGVNFSDLAKNHFGYNVQIENIKVGCQMGRMQELRNIFEKLDEIKS